MGFVNTRAHDDQAIAHSLEGYYLSVLACPLDSAEFLGHTRQSGESRGRGQTQPGQTCVRSRNWQKGSFLFPLGCGTFCAGSGPQISQSNEMATAIDVFNKTPTTKLLMRTYTLYDITWDKKIPDGIWGGGDNKTSRVYSRPSIYYNGMCPLRGPVCLFLI